MKRQICCLVACELLLAALLLQLAAGQEKTVCIVTSQPGSLKRCLQDAAALDIVLVEDHTMEPYDGPPLEIMRNITLRSPAGRQPDAWPVLDLAFSKAGVQLCSSCVFTLHNLVTRNERKGSGPPLYDFFTGKPGSRVRSLNTYRLRHVCTPGDMQLKAVLALQRSQLFQSKTAPQDAVLKNVTYRGKLYANSVWSNDLTYDVSYKLEEGAGEEGGYAELLANSTRLCEAYVDKACLTNMNADSCVRQLMDALLAPAPAQKQPHLAPAAAAAIIIPLVLGFLVAGGVAAWWLRRRCKQGRQLPKGPAEPGDLTQPQHSARKGLLPRTTGGTCTTETSSHSSGPRGSGKPLGRTTGWEQIDSQAAPSMGLVEDSSIELGCFVGAGSFGKVFKGRWNGMDVAVKVIEHSGSSAAAVQQEMEMMMAFQHPNIVRAFFCTTYEHREGGRLSSEYSSSMPSRHNSGIVLGSGASFTSPAGSLHPVRLGSLGAPVGTNTGLNVTLVGSASAATATNACSRCASQAAAASGCSCSSLRASGSGDATLSISEGAACCHGKPTPCQFCSSPAVVVAATAACAAPLCSCRKQHPDATQQDSSAVSVPASAARPGSFGCSSSGSGSRQLVHLTDSLGSSIDCKCVAAAPSTSELRRTKSIKEPCKRFESWLVLEFCDEGSLTHYLSQWPAPAEGPADEQIMLRVLQLLQDTAQGLQELHNSKTVHGDLNARNVLVASCPEAPSGVQGKLCDLGLSRSVKQHQTHRTTNTIGTMTHMSPEMLRSGQMSVCADIYALSIMMWELYTGEDAFQRLQHPGQFFETVVLQDLRPVIPRGMPADYQLLMQHCWATEPAARPNIARVLECLQYMIKERLQHRRNSGGRAGPQEGSASDPLPALLASSPPHRKPHWWQHHQLQRMALMKRVSLSSDSASHHGPSPQGSSAVLPCLTPAWDPATPPHSNSLLPVVDVEQPADASQPLDNAANSNLQDRRQQAQTAQEQPPPGYVSQPLPGALASSSRGSFAFLRSASMRRVSRDGQVCSREGSVGERAGRESSGSRSSSSGKLPTLFAGLAAGVRQASFSLREMSFDSRGASWSTRKGSQTGSVGDHAWFV